MSAARRATLPRLELAAVGEEACEGATPLHLEDGGNQTTYYWLRVRGASGSWLEGSPKAPAGEYVRFPVVLLADGSPWAEACLDLIADTEGRTERNMLSLGGVAGDLGCFRRFVDEDGIDWREFGVRKFVRPTYRHLGRLKRQVRLGAVADGMARRRMNVVIRFYRWLEDPRSMRWHASFEGRDSSLVLTGAMFLDDNENQGGLGAVQLVRHLRRCDFRAATRFLMEDARSQAFPPPQQQ